MGGKTTDQNVSSTTGFVAICTVLYPKEMNKLKLVVTRCTPFKQCALDLRKKKKSGTTQTGLRVGSSGD